MTRPAGASGTPLAAASSARCVVAGGKAELGVAEGLIFGNSPVALPAPTMELLVPVSWGGNAPVNPGDPADPDDGPAAPVEPGDPVETVDDPRGAGDRCGDDADRPGEVAAGLLGADDGDGLPATDLAGVGWTTSMLAVAVGGVHGVSEGTLAVAVSVTAAADVPAGTSACIW